MQSYFIFIGTNTYKNKLTGHNGDCGASYFPNISPPYKKIWDYPKRPLAQIHIT